MLVFYFNSEEKKRSVGIDFSLTEDDVDRQIDR